MALNFVYCGVGMLIGTIIVHYIFETFSCILFFIIQIESLQIKIRKEAYIKMLRMPMSWFDKPENNAGTLSARLAVDCTTLSTLVSTVVQVNIQNIGSLIAGTIIAFNASWMVALVTLAVAPLSVLGGSIKAK